MFQFIKEITIIGFKSFAEKTTIQFKDGLNMVVGPNGCGKSNIIDAFCWGLGENRLKNLRAQNHEELIFSGNDNRSGSGYASVSFVIDNSRRILNTDSNEVRVKRTLNKNQENGYFINDVACRLKDIQQLFMDTGLGRHGYSIMQQGKIDQIVTGKPQERRQIFEEASGISLSKMMIKESESKLTKTKDNLHRLKDIISEVEVQVTSLGKQAQKAVQFKETKKEIETLEKDIFIYRFIDLDQKIKHKDEKTEKIEKELQNLMKEQELLKKETDDDFYEIGRLEDLIDKVRDKEKVLLVDDARVSQKMELMKSKHQDTKSVMSKLKEKQNQLFKDQASRRDLLDSLELKKHSLMESQEQSLEYKKELIEEIESYNELIKNYQQSMKQLSQVIQDKEKNLYQDFLEKQQALISIVENLEDQYSVPSLKLKNSEEYQKIQQWFSSLQVHPLLKTQLKDLSDFNVINSSIQDLKKEVLGVEKDFMALPTVLQNLLKDEPTKDYSLKESGSKEELTRELNELKTRKQKKESDLLLVEETKNKALNVYEKEFLIKEPKQNDQIAIEVQYSKTQEEIVFYNAQAEQLEEEIEALQDQQEEMQDSILNYGEEFEQFQQQKQALAKEMKENQALMMNKTESIKKMKEKEQEITVKKEQLGEAIQKLYLDSKEGMIQQDILKKDFFDRYKKELGQQVAEQPEYIESFNKKQFHIVDHQKRIQEKKQLLENIGLVNFLAIEEFKEVNDRYLYLSKNEKDLLKSQQDLLLLIEQTNKKATQDFMTVFNKVNENLASIFTRAFEGGSCEMVLLDKENPLESGIDIIAKPPGKKLQSLILLSGGEKTMVTLSLMFSLFMVKPSPFCLLDEVDAALDELNIQRFLRILNDFKTNVQFLIITHNRITAQKGDVFYGVTMQETGVTKVFSFKPDNDTGTQSQVTA